MSDDEIISDQLAFFAKHQAGCAFAAVAAKNPLHYEWAQRIVSLSELDDLDSFIGDAIGEVGSSTLSLIFPDVRTDDDLGALIPRLQTELIYLHDVHDTLANRCYRFRAKVGADDAFISGFGPFASMPVTRRSPHTSLIMRIKPRPEYDWYLKEPDEGIVHVADMDMKGMTDRTLKRMWNNSFLTTAGLLGKKPDEESAAKTTFVVSLERANQIFA